MATGTINWVNANKRHAFVAPDAGGPELYVEPPREGAPTALFAGASVEFDLRQGAERHVAATDVALACALEARIWS